MVPTSFEESNDVLGKPPSMSDDECSCLSILRVENNNGLPMVISCWKMTKEELEEVNRTGRVWLGVCGVTMPPVIVTGIKPFGGAQ